MPEIQTNRLRLVPLTMDHVEQMHALSVDPDVRKYLFEDQIIPLSRVREMIAASELCFSDHGSGFFAMYIDIENDPFDGQFTGFCGHRIFENDEDMELLVLEPIDDVIKEIDED